MLKASLLFHKILIVKNVGRGTYQFKSYPLIALVTWWKQVLTMHDHFVRSTMAAVMQHFIDPSLGNRIARKEGLAVLHPLLSPTRITAPELCQEPIEFSINEKRFSD
jgi:hypothetical protein